MYPHRIRLLGPWQAVPVAWTDAETAAQLRTENLPPARIVKVPVAFADLRSGNRPCVTQLRRSFGLPRRLDTWERVWLVRGDYSPGATSRYHAAWRLNGVELDDVPTDNDDEVTTIYHPLRSDVTAVLSARNQLVVEVETGQQPNRAMFAGAAIEIGRRAFIRRVRAWPHRVAEGRSLWVQVDVVCDDDSAHIELYALIDGRTAEYCRPQPVAREMSHLFRLDAPAFSVGAVVRLRVDVVCGADIWYTAEMPIAVTD